MKQYKICHSGITWNMSNDAVEEPMKDLSELGYYGFETFGWTVEWWNENRAEDGGFRGLVQKYRLPVVAVYCPVAFYEPDGAAEEVEKTIKWIDAGKAENASAVVLQAGGRKQNADHGGKYPHWDALGKAFNEVGAYAKEKGMVTAIHPHTWTLIETPEEIDTILGAVDENLVGFAPDTGQIAKGGGDPVAVLKKHAHRLQHVHFKDWGGGRKTTYHEYEPLGLGVVDLQGILDVMEDADYDGLVTVELDGSGERIRTPRKAALIAQQWLEAVLGNCAVWGRNYGRNL